MSVVMSIAARGLSSTTMVRSLSQLYGAGPAFARFFDRHLVDMQRSRNATIERSGRVLEGCKAGFGLGYAAPVIVVAAGQVILGNPLSAIATVGTAATLTNPMAMTCAAVGAVLYGYGALSEDERGTLVSKLSEGLQIGVELIRSVIDFAVRSLRELLGGEQLAELRGYLREAAEALGHHLGDVTRLLRDRITDGVDIAATGAMHVVARGGMLVREGAGTIVEQSTAIATSAYRTANHGVESAARLTRRAAKCDDDKGA